MKSRTHGKKPHPKGDKPKTFIGPISVNSKGKGFVTTPYFEEDIEIEAGSLNTALNKDEVEIAIHEKGKNAYGEITRIVKRAKSQFVGMVEKAENAYYLIPDDKRMYKDILIPDNKINGAKDGVKALVKITEWKDAKKNPEGEVLKVLGEKGNNDVEMEAIVYESGFEYNYPEAVVREAEIIEKTEKPIPQEEIIKRKDFRNTTTFTIDPVDAKDFDDAISFKELGGNVYEIGVHIADVSHYVREGTALDREALKRAFSVYLVDRTIPMLPHVLSNDICSLNPNEDKLTFSAVFKIAHRGNQIEILERWFGKTVINSDKRFSYEDAQATLNAGSGNYFKELNTLNIIAKIFQAEKFKQGAIDFEQDEVKFELDKNGKPIRAYRKQRLDTHKLVEEYMLLANREVAQFIEQGLSKKGKEKTFLYRIHDVPNKEKIAGLALFVKALGYNLPVSKAGTTSKDISALLKSIEGKAEESLIKTAAIRSMAKAIYSTQNIGHFGLSFPFYTHFTSPIRRYPDLLVHRLLFKHLNGVPVSAQELETLQKSAIHSTDREIAAAEAERASIKLKQVEYMQDKVGQVFDGVISGVTEWGIYVEEAETRSEGMVKLRDLADDYYVLDQKNYAIVGEKTKKKYTLGDKVRIKVAGADPDRRVLDYVIV